MNNCIQINIKKYDNFNVYLELLEIDKKEIKLNLSSWFSQFVKGYRFSPKFKNHIWDGKIRFYDSRNSTLPLGLLNELIKFCKTMKYSYEIENILKINNFNGLEIPEIQEFIETFVSSLNFDKLSKPIIVRPYQYKYFAKFIKENILLMESPTASGKSLIIYMCIRYALNVIEKGTQVLLIVPTIQLVEQMFSDFKDYGFNSEKYCARIYADSKEKFIKLKTPKPIIISTWQSLQNCEPEEFNNIQMLCGDEVHTLGANKAKTIITNCKNARFRLGTTGTLQSKDVCSEWTIKGMFSEPVKYTDTMTLIKKNYISNFEINVVNLIYSDEICKMNNKLDYESEIDFINMHDSKVNFIIKLIQKIISKNENVLVLFKTLEYGKKIVSFLENVGLKAFYVDGTIKTKVRENVRTKMELSGGQIAVCSYGTFSTGINIKNLHNLIFAQTTKAEIKVLQSLGRLLRLHKTKKIAKIYDLVDNMKYKSRLNYCLKHFEERNSIYSSGGFTVKYFDINIG